MEKHNENNSKNHNGGGGSGGDDDKMGSSPLPNSRKVPPGAKPNTVEEGVKGESVADRRVPNTLGEDRAPQNRVAAINNDGDHNSTLPSKKETRMMRSGNSRSGGDCSSPNADPGIPKKSYAHQLQHDLLAKQSFKKAEHHSKPGATSSTTVVTSIKMERMKQAQFVSGRHVKAPATDGTLPNGGGAPPYTTNADDRRTAGATSLKHPPLSSSSTIRSETVPSLLQESRDHNYYLSRIAEVTRLDQRIMDKMALQQSTNDTASASIQILPPTTNNDVVLNAAASRKVAAGLLMDEKDCNRRPSFGDLGGSDRTSKSGGGFVDRESPLLFDNSSSDLEYGTHELVLRRDGKTHPENEGLVIAITIDEHEETEDVFIPSAVEYDPDAKPPIYQNRRVRLYSLVVVVVLMAIAVAVSVGITTAARGNGETTTAKAQYRQSLGIREKVERLVGEESLEDVTSPYSKALRWITLQDAMELLPEDPRFLQRYIMAYFYFATSEKHVWYSCNPPTQNEIETTCEFEKLYSKIPSLVRVGVPGSVRWLSIASECEWAGVQCDAFQQVQDINLDASDMTGAFPDGVRFLPFLQSLSLSVGQLKGSIPPQIQELKHLEHLDVSMNSIAGPIPEELFLLPSLHRLDASANQLGGTIGPSLGTLRDLRWLRLQENVLIGSLPDEIGGLESAFDVQFGSNLLTGTIPSSIGNARSLRLLHLPENKMRGTLPTELGETQLTDLRVHNNRQLTGRIPFESLPLDIFVLNLYNCNFTGTISEGIAKVKALAVFEAHNNGLWGRIPAEVEQLTNLKTFSIYGNAITGSIPEGVCNLRGRGTGKLETIEADCLAGGGDSGGDGPEVFCALGCCDLCCDASGDNCVDPTSN